MTVAGLFDLNHLIYIMNKIAPKKLLIYYFLFLTSVFLIADLYKFNTNCFTNIEINKVLYVF